MTPAEEKAGIRLFKITSGLGSSRPRIRWWWIGTAFALLLAGAVPILGRVGIGLDPDRVWERGQASYQSNRLDAAEGAVNALAKLRRATVKDSILRAEVDMARGRIDPALAALAMVPDSHREAPQARFLSGKLEFRRDRAREAEAHWKRAVKLDPTRIDSRRSLSYLYALQLRKREFNEQFQEIAARQPVTFAHAFFWSQINCGIYDPLEASIKLRRFLDADPEDRQSRFALFEVCLKLEKVEDSQRLLANLPDCNGDVLAGRARVALLKGDAAKLASLLAGAKDDKPEIARISGRLALLNGDGDAAIHAFRNALAADPDDSDTLQGLAKALRLVGDDAGAGIYLEKVRVRSQLWELVQRASQGNAPANLGLLRSLGKACEAANRPAEARAWYSLVIASDPLDSEAQQSLFRLSTPKQSLIRIRPAAYQVNHDPTTEGPIDG